MAEKAKAVTPKDWACNVAIIGNSGTGKSTSIENLPDKRTVVLNIENKKLPFRKKFTNEIRIKDYRQMLGTPASGGAAGVEGYLPQAIASPNIDFIVLESFTSWAEMLLRYAKQYKTGYDVYNLYNDEITRFMEMIKFQDSKMIFMIGIPELVQGVDGLEQKRMKVSGKQWEGMIEKEFPIVFFTKVVKNDSDQPEYFFETQTDGTTSAKTPRDMFEENIIPNDLIDVAKAIRNYYK